MALRYLVESVQNILIDIFIAFITTVGNDLNLPLAKLIYRCMSYTDTHSTDTQSSVKLDSL